MTTPLLGDRVHYAGVACLLVAVVTFIAAVAVFMAGFEPAFLAMPFSLALFTLGIGVLCVGRR
ncbi:hypothetical protein [Cryobacterium sp. PAMC25264]|uniref:hypothetical protein n=1 Tax=Cryobacterium sp. PAMC25264 TaxID=2861288 RepID=UPI001C63604E|nr:hypothetical protein [Cryobacterium sp. PAMC25264]QYF73964.1 hypothetical protein KY500_01500 [Cryobacterium sp. PAMC25264]